MTVIENSAGSVTEVLYRRQLLEILASSRPTVVFGGRGMGKSSVLQWLAAEMKARLIDGRAVDTASSVLDDALTDLMGDKPVHIVIDDLDYLLNEERDSHAAIQVLVDKVDALRAEVTQRQKRMIVGSTSPISQFLRSAFADFWSRIETRFDPKPLFPWSVGWREALHSEALRRFPRGGQDAARAVVEASGGHPSLVAAAFTILQEYEMSRAST